MTYPSKRPITSTEWAFLHALARLSREQGLPPTLREIGAHLGIASTGHLRALHASLALRSLVSAPSGQHRSLRILPAGLAYLQPDAESEATHG